MLIALASFPPMIYLREAQALYAVHPIQAIVMVVVAGTLPLAAGLIVHLRDRYRRVSV